MTLRDPSDAADEGSADVSAPAMGICGFPQAASRESDRAVDKQNTRNSFNFSCYSNLQIVFFGFGRKKQGKSAHLKMGRLSPCLEVALIVRTNFQCSQGTERRSDRKQSAAKRSSRSIAPSHNGQRAPAPLRYAAGRTGRNESHGRRRSRPVPVQSWSA